MTLNAASSNPYPGPWAFEAKDRPRFFGREKEISELRSLVLAHPLVLLYAESGAGKSSLVNAGLVEALRKRGFEVLPIARVVGPAEVGQGTRNVYVHNTLRCWATDGLNASAKGRTMIGFLWHRKPPESQEAGFKGRVLIFDQFEELFTAYPDRWQEREKFFKQLQRVLDYQGDSGIEAANPPGPRQLGRLPGRFVHRVLLVMREEYLAALDSYAPLLTGRLRVRYRLECLQEKPALAAIIRPLEGTGRSYAQGAAEDLRNDLLKIRAASPTGRAVEARGEFVSPVQLQLVCHNLWKRLKPEDRQITRNMIRDVGGIDEALLGFYEECLHTTRQKTGVSERALRRLFAHELITPAGTRGNVFREEKQTGGVPNQAVEKLEDLHLLRTEHRAGGQWYELSHDRFIKPIQDSQSAYDRRTTRDRVFVGFVLLLLLTIGVSWALATRKIDRETKAAQEREREAEQKTLKFLLNYQLTSADAYDWYRQSDSDTQIELVRRVKVMLQSDLSPERALGVRLAPWAAAGDFWKGVEKPDGLLWKYGEWLELATVDWPELPSFPAHLAEKATEGTEQEKYVAFCLIGAAAERLALRARIVLSPHEQVRTQELDKQFGHLCVDAIANESKKNRAGVVSAAFWAAARLGRQLTPDLMQGADIYFDGEPLGMTFVRIPEGDALPGSADHEKGHELDEEYPEKPTPIKSVWLSQTEVTLSQFLSGEEDFPKLSEDEILAIERQAEFLEGPGKESNPAFVAIHSIAPVTAEGYCRWLTRKSAERGEKKTYRLPTEAEWEYACGGGGSRAFCYGDSREYLEFFANFEGASASFEVQRKMPNYYGLFDMHGNLWEICCTRYQNLYGERAQDACHPEIDLLERVVQRGGANYSPAKACRSAQRNYLRPRDILSNTGFRIVLEMQEP